MKTKLHALPILAVAAIFILPFVLMTIRGIENRLQAAEPSVSDEYSPATMKEALDVISGRSTSISARPW